jgi:bifunctional DNA-binding transcriptional regulator/antitoxin component of YhaV-PrlF toxin-antitoxin module
MDALGIKVGDYIRVKVEDGAIVIQPLEAASQEQGQDALRDIHNGLGQIRRELVADLENIGTPAVSRTKKVMLSQTILELDVLILSAKHRLGYGQTKRARRAKKRESAPSKPTDTGASKPIRTEAK